MNTMNVKVLTCHIDKEIVMAVDRWRDRHPMQPSRRIAVRTLLKMALRGLERQAAAKVIVPAVPAPHCAEASTIAPAGEPT